MKIVGIIPARFGSTRLPGKPLKLIDEKPVIQHVVEQSLKAVPAVIVATDDQRIMETVNAFGAKALMTRKDHPSGSDRIAEVARQIDADIIVNIQGDEPFVEPEMIRAAVEPLLDDPDLKMSTVCRKIIRDDDFHNPNTVKVVTDLNNNALYFSRSIIPFPRNNESVSVFEHIGLYVYRKSFLLALVSWSQTPLEKAESLEQLRVLENGYTIRVVKTDLGYGAPCIDTAEDLEKARKYLKARK